jgi:hypothetical protein
MEPLLRRQIYRGIDGGRLRENARVGALEKPSSDWSPGIVEAHDFYLKGMRLFLVARVVVGFCFSVNCASGIDEAFASSIMMDYLSAPSDSC